MKRLLYLLATAALATACGGNSGYTINGKVDNAQDGDSVFLQIRENRQMTTVQSTVIKNGTFTFSGQQDTAKVCYVIYTDIDENSTGIDFFLENGNIDITLGTDKSAATGTPNNNAYQSIRDRIEELQAEAVEINNQQYDSTLTDTQRAEINAKIEELNLQISDATIDGCRDNITNAAGIYLLKQSYYYMDDQQLADITALIPDNFLTDPAVASIKQYAEKKKATAVGQKFADLQLNDPDGNAVKLSDYVGKSKYVLVDFWASWCGPCVREMPTLKKAYADYKSKGFQIVGVSLDRNAEDWKKGIADLGITWPQMSDLKYWDSAAADIYAVNSIPHTVLIDQNGTIIERGLRGDALLDKLAELTRQ